LESQYSELEVKLESQKSEMENLRADLVHTKDEISQANGALAAMNGRIEVLLAKVSGAPSVPAPTVPAVPPSTTGARVLTAKELYDEGRTLLARKQYNRAILSFEELVGLYPASDLADDALMGVAESFVARDDQRRALQIYLEIVKRYPQGDRVLQAAIATGRAYEALGEFSDAKTVYEGLRDRYPGTVEATMAADRLDELEHAQNTDRSNRNDPSSQFQRGEP